MRTPVLLLLCVSVVNAAPKDTRTVLLPASLLQAGGGLLGGKLKLGTGFERALSLDLSPEQWWNSSASLQFSTSAGYCTDSTPCAITRLAEIVGKGVSTCSTCSAGKFQLTDCGKENDRECVPCSTCGLGQHESVACQPTQDTKCAACAVVSNARFVTAGSCDYACNSGFFKSTAGACGPCTVCSGALFQKTACTATADTVCAVKGLTGTIASIDHQDSDATGRINLASAPYTFSSPVALVGPPSRNGPDSCVVRLSRTTNGYRVWLAEARQHDVWHITESTSWIVLEKGQGANFYVDTINLSGTLITVTPPSDGLGNRPFIFPLIQSTRNGADPTMTTASAPSSSRSMRGFVKTRTSFAGVTGVSFKLRLDGDNGSPALALQEETVGYLAINSGCTGSANTDANLSTMCKTTSGTIVIGGQNYDYVLGVVYTASGRRNTQIFTFGKTFKTTPIVLANIQSLNGGNQCELRTVSVSTTNYQFLIDEDPATPDSYWHTEENVAVLAIGQLA